MSGRLPATVKRLLIGIAAALLGWQSVTAMAANYFVDAVIGNDTYTGTSPAVQNSGTNVGPWRTLTKVSAAAFQPGDAVYFRCGQSWRGTLLVASSADPARPIKYSRFGNDCTDFNKPTITGAAALNGWQQYSGNIYVATTWFSVYQLFADGVALRLAQHPNTDYQIQPSARGMMVTDQVPAPPDLMSGISDAELAAIADRDLVGAGIHIRVNDFIINDRTIAAFDPANLMITLNQRTERAILKNWGYYLDNKLWMLDEPGEFFFDGSNPADMKVYVWMPDGQAPGSRVIGASNNYAIDATGAANVTIEAMRADKSGVGVAMGNSTNVIARTIDVADSYYRGMTANGARDGTIDSCNVRRSVREGILAGTATNFKILNNRIIDSGVIGSPVQTRGAISSSGHGMAIKGNYILNSGYHGIAFGKTSDVANNYVENACLILNDCGGIYTGNSAASNDDSSPHNSYVIGNTVIGVYGNQNGRDPAPIHALTPGIYLDYRTSGVYVANNTISKADMGLFLHAASSNVVTDNTFHDYETFAIRIKEYRFQRITSPNRIQRNKFFPLISGPAIMLVPAEESVTGLATYDFNHYSALYADNPAILDIAKITVYLNNRYSDRFLNLQQWRQAGNDTSGTIFDDFGIAPFAFQPVTGINLLANGTFDSDVAGWIAFAAQGDAALAWRSDCPSPGCIALTAGGLSSSGSLISSAFAVEAGKTYLMRFTNRAGQDSFPATIVPRMAGPRSYDRFESWYPITVLPTWQAHSVLFNVPADLVLQPGDRGGRIDFAVPSNQTMYMDNVRVDEVTYTANDPGDDAFLLLNPTSYDASVNCPDAASAPEKCIEYVRFDDGTPVAWPITLGPRKSSIVIWAGNPFRRQ